MALAARPFHANHAPFLDSSNDDPLARALQPPPDESPEQRAMREQMQRDAIRISKEIDEDIQESRKTFERRKKAIKILLLGQAESGKSTTLKNFQLAFSPQHFRSERLAWKTIIQLNLIRSIKVLLEVLQIEWAEQSQSPSSNGLSTPHNSAKPPRSSSPPTLSPATQMSVASGSSAPQMPMSAKARGKMPAHLAAANGTTATGIPMSRPSSGAVLSTTNTTAGTPAGANATGVRFSAAPPATHARTPSGLTDNHKRIRVRLLPLLAIEEELTKKLFPEFSTSGLGYTSVSAWGAASGESSESMAEEGVSILGTSGVSPSGEVIYRPPIREVCVRAGSGWKGLLNQFTSGDNGKKKRPGSGDSRPDDPTTVLAACRDDIVSIWEDTVVRGVLKKRGIRLMDMPGFFLNDAARIATLNYEPTDDDIVRARLRTLGVEEHRFTMESGGSVGSEWYIYDVGGSRSVRPHWIPYFDDVQAIIFLAPLAFNLMLEEDPKVNRLEDSISLWREICNNQLLSKTTLILFLNKMDILQATLAAGIRVQKYVPSYGDQPNDITHVVKYFRDKFRGYHKRLSPRTRPFYWHETSVIDTRATSIILVGVREGILRAHLESVNVI